MHCRPQDRVFSLHTTWSIPGLWSVGWFSLWAASWTRTRVSRNNLANHSLNYCKSLYYFISKIRKTTKWFINKWKLFIKVIIIIISNLIFHIYIGFSNFLRKPNPILAKLFTSATTLCFFFLRGRLFSLKVVLFQWICIKPASL